MLVCNFGKNGIDKYRQLVENHFRIHFEKGAAYLRVAQSLCQTFKINSRFAIFKFEINFLKIYH